MMAVFKTKLLFCFIFHILYRDIRGQCPSNRVRGEGNPKGKDDRIDTFGTGLGILLDATDNEYQINCCGVVNSWEFYVKTNTGTVQLQVWRPVTTGQYKLVGENSFTTTNANNEHLYSVPANERISVKDGDYIGFYTAGQPMISHKVEGDATDGYTYSTTIGAQTVGSTYDWGSQTADTRKEYAINVQLGPGNSPTITNLDSTVTFPDSTTANSLIFTVTWTDADPLDTLTAEITTTTSSFSFDTSNGQVRNVGALPYGNTALNFRVTDDCGRTDTGTLTVTVTNSAPVITNLPSTTDISEDHDTEKLLYTIITTDGSLSDTVTCSIANSNPTTDNFFTRLNGTTTYYGIYIKAQPTLSYDSARQYTLSISCTDTKDTVQDTFIVYVNRNNPPSFVNLQATVTIAANSTTTGNVIYTVQSTDSDSSQLYYNMTCVPAACPFTIHNSGEILATSDLSQHTVPGYDLFVYVYDGNTLVGPRTLTVIISGINTAPIITNLPLASPISVSENSALSLSVFQVSISDVNAGDNHVYSASYNPSLGSTLFSLNTATGLVSTSSTQNINYESVVSTSTTFAIIITVTDGQASVSQTLSIAIVDLNEAPVFGKASYAISGNEGSAGSTVGNPSFDVTDPDAGASQSYSIDCSTFLMNSNTGVVTFSHDYDLDKTGTASSVTCTVTVTDGELTDTASLVVTINNINDNTPTFGSSTYTFYAQPNTGVGTVLGSVPATDGDVGTFGTVSYSLNQTGLGNEYFGVQSNGDFYVKNGLTSFSSGTTLSITTIVQDTGGLQDTAVVTVVIPESTTAAPTTTTDRYMTFLEDSRNVAWVTIACVMLAGLVLLWAYLIVRFGSFPCKNGSYKPNAKKVNRWPPFHQKEQIRLQQRNPPKHSWKKNWEAWGSRDHKYGQNIPNLHI
ncbi:cadherin-23-like [Ostrea edulis]|uniref:cadherin-23-like n=1 Tax=Ostrea edulis TaxID=37623 RepID=UPI0024AF2A80|nr:cadherin-23-like [Ostrea edulis]